MKVTIENYQAIKKAELDFLPGVTAIIGPTNNGKSSIIRAIKAAVNNQGGNGFINYDADEATVSITYDNHNIKWNKHKKQGKSYYEVDGNVLNKIGQTQVKEVADIMNMNEIEVGNERFQINFWKQMDKPFLVDKTPYQLFDFISKSKEQELVATLQANTEAKYKELNKDILSLNAKANLVTETMAGLNSEIEAMNKLDNVDLAVLTKVINLCSKLKDLTARIDSIDDRLVSLNTSLTKHNKLVDTLSKAVTSIEDINEVYKQGTVISDKLEKVSAALTTSNGVLSNSNDVISKTEVKINKIEKLTKQIDSTKSSITEVQKVLDSVTLVDNRLNNMNTLLKTYSNDLTKASEEISSFKVCPLCERPLNEKGEHLHE